MASSLDILRPAPSPPTIRSPLDSTAHDLEQRCIRIAQIVDTRDWNDPNLSRWLVSDFTAIIDVSSTRGSSAIPMQGRDAFINYFHRHNKTRIVGVSNVTSEVDEEAGVASVWLLLDLSDPKERSPRENVTMFSWRRERGAWRCWQQRGMRGVSGYRI